MKTILLASALLIGGTAYAQADPRDAGQPIGSGATLQPGTSMGERDTMGPQAQPPADPTAMPPADAAPMPPADAMTMPPPPPATTGSTMGTTGSGTVVVQQGGNMTAPPETRAEYPRCSRTVTDNCVQDDSRARDTKRSRR